MIVSDKITYETNEIIRDIRNEIEFWSQVEILAKRARSKFLLDSAEKHIKEAISYGLKYFDMSTLQRKCMTYLNLVDTWH